MNRQEDRLRSFDGTEIYLQMWQAPEAKGLLVVTHGLAEHSECYSRIIERWDLRHWDVVAWDLRGHGHSEGQRGYIERFSDFTKDFNQVLAYLNDRSKLAERPLVLFGHSMGALITFSTALLYHNWPISGVVLSSPLFGVALKVPYWKDKAASILAEYLPRLTLSNEINLNHLTHDDKLVTQFERDPLRHEKVSPSLYLALQNQMVWAAEHAHQWKLPIQFQMAGDDRIVSLDKANEVFETIETSNKQKFVYDNFYHEIFNELGCETVDDDFKDFLQKTLSRNG